MNNIILYKKIAGGGKSRDLFVPTNENEEEISIRLCYSFFFNFFLFYTQNQVAQINS